MPVSPELVKVVNVDAEGLLPTTIVPPKPAPLAYVTPFVGVVGVALVLLTTMYPEGAGEDAVNEPFIAVLVALGNVNAVGAVGAVHAGGTVQVNEISSTLAGGCVPVDVLLTHSKTNLQDTPA